MIKRILAIILAIMILPLSGLAAGGDTAQTAAEISRDGEIVRALGFLKDTEPGDNISFLDYGAFLLDLLINDDTVPTDEEILQMCEKNGYFYSAKTVKNRPGDTITVDEAVYGAVQLLGYGTVYGGSKYLVGANTLGISKGLGSNLNRPLTGDVLFTLAHNIMKADIMSMTGYSDSGVSYTADGGRTILSEAHGIYSAKGRITATDATGLYSADGAASKDCVEIDQTVYNVGETNAKGLLGHKVRFYYRSDKSLDKPIILYIESTEDSIITINGLDVDKNSATETELVYFKGDKSCTAKLDRDAAIIYNGVAAADFDRSLFDIKTGDITVIGQRAVIIRSFTTMWVKSVNTDTYIVTPFYGEQLKLDPNGDTNIEVLNPEGKKQFVIDIKTNDVLSVMKSTDGKSITVIRSNNRVAGRITSKRTDSYGRELMKIDGTEYPISGEYAAVSHSGKVEPEIGVNANFCLSAFGEIYGILTPKYGTYQVGYIVSLSAPKNGFETAKAKIYVPDNGFMVYEFADKVAFDDDSTKTKAENLADKFKDTKNEFKDGKNFKRQLIGYTLDKNGKISKVDLASAGATGEKEQSLKCIYNYSDTGSQLFYREYAQGMGGKVLTGNATVIKASPKDDAVDEDFFGKGTLVEQTSYYVEAYALTQSALAADYIVLFPQGGNTPDTEHYFLVNTIYNTLADDGTTVQCMDGMEIGGGSVNTQPLTVKVRDNCDISAIESGDIIYAQMDAKKMMMSYNMLYDFSEVKLGTPQGENCDNYQNHEFGGEHRYFIASVMKTSGNYGEIAIGPDADTSRSVELMSFTGHKGISVYDTTARTEDGRVYIGNVSDITGYEDSTEKYSIIWSYYFWSSPKGIVVYKR